MLLDISTPAPIGHVAVVVPIREGDSVLACLESVAHARSMVSVDVSVAVVGDACLVSTLDLARGHRGVRIVDAEPGMGLGLPPRAVASRFAIAHMTAPTRSTWIAHTQGSFLVPENWLVDQLALANSGADLVVGAVEGVDAGRANAANLGIRASTYMAAGGYRASGESADLDLVARSALRGNVVSDRDNQVIRAAVAPRHRPLAMSSYGRQLRALDDALAL